MNNQITKANASKVRASMIVEAANGPTTTIADKILNGMKVALVPDVLANSCGVLVSYEWVDHLNRDQCTEGEMNNRWRRR